MDPITLAIVFIGVAAVLFFGLGLWAVATGRRVEQRVTRYVTPHLATEAELAQLTRAPIVVAVRGHGRRTGSVRLALSRRIGRQRYVQSLGRDLQRAGLGLTPTEFLVLRGVTAALLVLFALAYLAVPLLPLRVLLLAAAPILGWTLPMSIVNALQHRRARRIERQLPDALEMLCGALEGGSGLAQAMGLAGREMDNPIAEELTRTVREIGLGLTQQEALLGLVDRVPSEDLDMVVTAINIQHRVGGNLVHVLRTIAETMRERERVRGEVRSLTAQQQLSANVITLLPFIVVGILFLTSPNYIRRLFEPGVTQVLVYLGLAMVATGYVILRRITDIRV